MASLINEQLSIDSIALSAANGLSCRLCECSCEHRSIVRRHTQTRAHMRMFERSFGLNKRSRIDGDDFDMGAYGRIRTNL